MKLRSLIMALFAAFVVASGCATSDTPYDSSGYVTGSAHSNENYYAVIVSIEPGPLPDSAMNAKSGQTNGPQFVYLIRVRFDDRSYQTVTQVALDGLRVGDSVRIEHDHVRRY